MKPANQKVKSCLEHFGFELEIVILPSAARTAQLAADALGCGVGQIANSLIFKDQISDQAVLVMCAGDRRVDMQKVMRSTGFELCKADADFVREHTGFVIGGVPPVGHAHALPTLLDESLLRHEEIWAAAGTPDSVFRMTPHHLHQITAGEWQDIAQDKPE